MNKIKIPYGNDFLSYDFNDTYSFDLILPNENNVTRKQEVGIIKNAFNNCVGEDIEKLFNDPNCKVAIAVNDPTRPIPNNLLLPPLLKKIENYDIPSENISLFIATGTHKSLSKNEIIELLSPEITKKYRVNVHDCDDLNNLTFLGHSMSGTPIYINKDYYLHDIKLVVGHIEPHHFMGFSGGVKSAVIGLGGRKTIEANHSKILDPKAKMGSFTTNPMRKEVEEIGKTIGVDIAFNVILNSQKQITNAFYGNPYQVMRKGIESSAGACQVDSDGEYDIVIASPGGYPKDINLYQSQKAITHACTFLKKNGVVILAAACSEGPGSKLFENFFQGKHTWLEVINSFKKQKFRVGPHKSYQLALQLKDHPIILISEMKAKIVRKMLLKPARDISEAISQSKDFLQNTPNIAVLPYATHTMLRTGSGI
jgi:nickel-dependent lactate racemase